MNCKHCETEMVVFLEDFLVCPNLNCPHVHLDVGQRQGLRLREYCVKIGEEK